MSDTFHKHIRKALGDENLQLALDSNAERRLKARQSSYATLPEPWSVMRESAHQVRNEVISNLEEYLEEFVTNAKKNGMIVHQAKNADQAVEIVLDIAEEEGVRLIAKSKTMVSEEIELNQALEKNGIRPVETDLGEFIIQLRGEPPAHIITPAVHLRRGQVGQVFHEKLGIAMTDDIATLNAAARQALREVFIDADMGLTGVNFGIADTGSVCIITNEGNGRMVTTLPRVHVALMGIERIVPSMEELALMLYLLPRSATGQKMTVYTNIIRGPRAPGEIDGPKERHLILVDNGRRELRSSALRDALVCIRCGACLNACPVFREIGGHAYVNEQGESSTYPGPIGSVISPGLFGQGEYGHLARASSLCGACKEACPVDIDLPKMLLRVRAGGREINDKGNLNKIPGYLRIGLGLYTWIATSAGRFSFAQRMAGLGGRLLAGLSPGEENGGDRWMRMPGFTGWGQSKDFPAPAKRPFRERYAQLRDRDYPTADLEPSDGNGEGTGKDIREDKGEEDLTSQCQTTRVETLLERFGDELTALEGQFHLCEPGNLCGQILELLQERDISRVQAWESDQLPDGLLDDLREEGIQVGYEPDPEIKAGITGALGGIAETGTLILTSGRGQALTASLLPEIHIATLRPENLYGTLYEGLNLKDVREANSTVLISGPSRTADIEMTLTIGVHGPREVHVFCVKGIG